MATLSVQKAKELNKIKDEYIKKFKKVRKERIDEEHLKSKEYSPITTAISKLDDTINEKISLVDKSIKNVLEQNKTLITDIVPFTKNIEEIEIPEDVSFEKGLYKTPIAKSTPFMIQKDTKLNIPMDVVLEEDSSLNDSFHSQKSDSDMDKLNISSTLIEHVIGPIGSKYLPKITDVHYGIFFDKNQSVFKIGKSKVDIVENDLIIEGKTYQGTNGLWVLLTQDYKNLTDDQGDNLYRKEDFEMYKEILIKSDALYNKNNSSTNRPKAPQNTKYKNLLKPIYEEQKTFPVVGKGLINYNEHSVMYIQNLNELISRLNLIYASEMAGDNNFHNEKVGIIRFLTNLLEKHINDSKGTEYLIRLVNALPHKIINDKSIGSGLFNKILNSLPFEVHYPGYNYCGPGTKLEERLERGDKPINKLDEACQVHDIHYRDHNETSDRHVADKILENKAWERVTSKDAGIGERTAAYLTTNAMKIKRHFGMGLMDTELDLFQ